MKSHYRLVVTQSLIIAIFLMLGVSCSGQVIPYVSYTYDFWGKPVPAPQAYIPSQVIDGSNLEIGSLNKPSDLYVDYNNHLYILDTGNNRVVQVNSEWQVTRIIDRFFTREGDERFNRPEGLHVSKSGDIYIADTGNQRIVVLDKNGELIQVIGSPQTIDETVMSQGFIYQPIKVRVDAAERIYVVSRNLIDGFVVYDSAGDFRGFMGAPQVKPTLADYFWYRFATDEQRQSLALFLPTEYRAMDVNESGIIYAVKAGTVENDSINIMNPAGASVLKGDFVPSLIQQVGNRDMFMDIIARDNVYSVLVNTGKVLTFDQSGHLLYTFGERGHVIGTFENPVALTEFNGEMLVLDQTQNRITTFIPTMYVSLIHEAMDLYERGHYHEAASLWQEVLGINANYDIAYSEIGRTLLMQGKNAEAMTYFRNANDRENYSRAFVRYRHQLISENISLILTVIVSLACIYLVVAKIKQIKYASGFSKRKNKALQHFWQETLLGRKIYELYQGLRYAGYVAFHPFIGFWDLKHEKRGKLRHAITLVLGLLISYGVMRQYTAFVFNTTNINEFNIIMESLGIIIPFMLWVIISWAFTTLMEGKGNLVDITIMTAHAFWPVMVVGIPLALVSHSMSLDEKAFYDLVLAIALIWSLFLLFIGNMVTHDFTGIKNVFSIGVTVCGMGVALFVSLVFLTVVTQSVGFINSIYLEIFFRI